MKVKKSAELLWLLGILFVALGVSICSKADLGVSMIAAPAFIVSEAIVQLWSGFSVGVTEYIIQGLMLILLCLLIRRFNWRYLLAFAVGMIYGYTLNFFLWLLGGVSFSALWLRWLMLIIGDAITAFGIACFFRTYMPLQVYELFVAEFADRFHLPINRVKFGFDLSLLTISILLSLVLFGDAASFDFTSILHTSFHSIGLGTFVTTAINAPLIAWMSKLVDRFFEAEARWKKLEHGLKIA